jgi:hypothetical protein
MLPLLDRRSVSVIFANIEDILLSGTVSAAHDFARKDTKNGSVDLPKLS